MRTISRTVRCLACAIAMAGCNTDDLTSTTDGNPVLFEDMVMTGGQGDGLLPPGDSAVAPGMDAAVMAGDMAMQDLAVPTDLTMEDLTPPPVLDLLIPGIPPGALILNEVHATNQNGLADEDNQNSDWVEIYNTTNAPIDLTGVGLSNAAKTPFRWVFPPGSAIAAHQYLVVFASNKNRSVWGRPLHTNYSLDNGDDRVAITGPDGKELDYLPANRARLDMSACRIPDIMGPFQLCVTPTPRAANNGTSFPSMLTPPSVSVPGGFYASPQMVELSTVEMGAEIRYTLDGSEPTVMSPLYNAPIAIASRAGAPNKYAQIDTTPPNTYITFYAPQDKEVYKATVLRAATFANGKLSSNINTHTYFIDPDVANLYAGAAVISLGIDPPQLFNNGANPRGIMVSGPNGVNDNGSYCMACNWWLDRRVLGSIEMFRPDRSTAFRNDAGFKVSGNWSRTYPQKTLDVSFKDGYGVRSITENLFPARPYNKFRTFRLRDGGTDWLRALMRDSLVQSFARDMPSLHYAEHSRAVVFLDGEYWGQMELREHTKQDYLAQVFGIDEDKVDIVDVSCFGNNCDSAQAQEGNMLAFNAFWAYLTGHPNEIANNYNLLKQLVDTENLASYLAFELIAYNTDWPGNNNRWWRAQGQDHPWQFLLQDLDLTLNSPYRPGQPTGNPFGAVTGNSHVGTIAKAALTNSTYKTLFLNVFADLLNTSFSQPVMNARFQAVQAAMNPLMVEHYARWRPQNLTVQNWMSEQMVIQDFINRREAGILPHIQSYFGIGNTPRYTITVNVNDIKMGTVKINTVDLGLGGRLVDVMQPWQGKYFAGNPITATAIPAPGYKFVGWQGASMSNQATVTLNLNIDSALTATFAPDPMWMPPVKPVVPPPPPGMRNLALGAFATQSSINGNRHAGLAVDGDVSGAAADNSLALTNSEFQSWWQVDLGQVVDVYRVDLFNRTDGNVEQLSDFQIFVSQVDITNRTFNDLMNDGSVWKWGQVGPGYLTPSQLVGVKGRYVRVQLAGTGSLPLAEVQVMAVPQKTLVPDASLLRNLGLGRMATASSDGGGAAGLAVDGNPDIAMNAKTTAITATENQPWWEVDLGDKHVVSSVQLFSGTRVTNFMVFVSRQPMAGRKFVDLLVDQNIARFDISAPIGAFMKLPVEAVGRYVRIQRKELNVSLPLSEVVVMGLTAPAP